MVWPGLMPAPDWPQSPGQAGVSSQAGPPLSLLTAQGTDSNTLYTVYSDTPCVVPASIVTLCELRITLEPPFTVSTSLASLSTDVLLEAS